jgi:hypothetical protein
MNLSHYVTFTCASSYTVSALDYSAGVLSITADYTEDLEGRACTLDVAYNSSLIRGPAFSLAFDAKSDNEALLYSTRTGQQAQVSFIFRILSFACLALFALSLPHKLAGAELLASCQTVLLAYCFYPQPSFLLSSIKNFSLVAGGWSFFSSEKDPTFVEGFTDRVLPSPFFIESGLFVVILLLVCGVPWIALLIGRLWASRN